MVTDTIDLLIIFMSLSDNSYHISRLCLKDTVADSFPAVRYLNKAAACFSMLPSDISNNIFHLLIPGIVCCNNAQICQLSTDLAHRIATVFGPVSTAAKNADKRLGL